MELREIEANKKARIELRAHKKMWLN